LTDVKVPAMIAIKKKNFFIKKGLGFPTHEAFRFRLVYGINSTGKCKKIIFYTRILCGKIK